MPTLIMLKGLPASGKSTFARQMAQQEGYVRVNKDDLRAMLHSGKHSKGNEKQVLAIRDSIITDALQRGRNVIVDDTNLNPLHEQTLKTLAESLGADFRVEDSFLNEPIEKCIERDLKRRHSVGEHVIRQMYNQYLRPAPVEYRPDRFLPLAILCDIDGTIAHMKDRSPYDWSRVLEDTPDDALIGLLECYQPPKCQNVHVILLSGRDGVCRPETEAWLKKHHVPYQQLFMREQGDNRKDNIVKREIYDREIADKYNVLFVLDDRNQVVNMWRNDLGLKCLQVAEGDF